MSKDKLCINSTFKQQLTVAELRLLLEMTTDGLAWQQQHGVKWCFFPLTYKNRKWPKFKHAEGDNKGQLRKRKERRKDHRTVEEGKQVIPPSSLGKAVEQGRDSAPSQRLRVLTERREAPSRACISAALTAGIAAAPLTHAGSRDTAAPC